MSEKPENDGTFLLGGCRLQLKGNVHCHTDYSDGVLSPEEAIRAYRETGYDFLFLTEHREKLRRGKPADSASFDWPGFRVLSGLEYRCTANNGSKENLHILGLGTQDRSFWKPGQDMQETVDAINKASGIAIVAHPHWNGLTSADLVDLRGVHGIEIFNSTTDSCNSKGYAVTIWEELLNSNVRVCALAVDDTHYYTITDFLPTTCLLLTGLISGMDGSCWMYNPGRPVTSSKLYGREDFTRLVVRKFMSGNLGDTR